LAPLSQRGSQPCRLIAAFVKQTVALFALDAEAQSPQRARVPSGDKFALAAVLSVDGISELDKFFVAADSLREGPLETVGVRGAFGAARGGVAVGGVVVGHGNLGQVVPPFAGGALGEEGVRVGEQG
jgi:hypothetical protein